MAILGILLLQFTLMGMAAAGPLGFCPIPNLQDTFSDKCMASDSDSSPRGALGFLPDRVRELDAVSLEAAMNILQKSPNTYMAVLFYASWCPFSKQCRPVFNVLSSMFPTIHHVAVEESASRPSVLSRYGVHSFPALFLQNQTSRVRYHGSRKLDSIIHFYENITGIKSISPDFATQTSSSSLRGLDRVKDVESGVHCPYSWAKSPEKLLQQDTYLILAILFLVLRMFHFLFPKVPNEQSQSYRRHPSEQVYADEMGDNIDIEPTQKELSDLSKACNKLWELDLNRLVPGQDYEIDCGEGKKPWQEGDMAQNSLFCWVSEDVFRRPTYARFCDLLDNYNPNQRSSEVVTSDEKHEETAFVEEISRTAPIKYLHKYLVAKGLVSYHYEGFKRKMKSLWFDLFNRSGTRDSSSAFEHVFVGEVKQRQTEEVSGFHNWIAFYLEEAKGRIDYQGYIFPRRRGQIPASETQLLTIQFTWNGVLKSLSSTLIGVSPEFEIALYTLCFYGGEQDNHIELGPYNVNMKCYLLEGDKIGSAFPIAEN